MINSPLSESLKISLSGGMGGRGDVGGGGGEGDVGGEGRREWEGCLVGSLRLRLSSASYV